MKFTLVEYIYKSPFSNGLLFLAISFISWNFFGILFVINILLIYSFLERSEYFTFFKYTANAFFYVLLWNLGASSWLLNIKFGFFALILSVLIYLIPFLVFHFLRKSLNKIWLFVVVFILFEIANNFITSSYPLLTLGNLMGNQVILIQWYKFTTSIGGSLWLLCLAYLLYEFLKKQEKSYFIATILVFIVPVIFSVFMYKNQNYTPKNNLLIFNNKNYKGDKNDISISKYLIDKLKKRTDTLEYQYLLIPELKFKYNVSNIDNSLSIKTMNKILEQTSINNIIAGCEIKINDNEALNSLLFLNKKDKKITIKRKLVPFTEKFPKIWGKVINKINYVTKYKDDKQEILSELNIFPMICYEAYYANFNLFKKSRNMPIFMISSEEFLRNSLLGKKQLLNFSKIRAIENNSIMVRASSDGFSGIINSNGKIIEMNDKDIIAYFRY